MSNKKTLFSFALLATALALSISLHAEPGSAPPQITEELSSSDSSEAGAVPMVHPAAAPGVEAQPVPLAAPQTEDTLNSEGHLFDSEPYTWLASMENKAESFVTVAQRFPPPEGYVPIVLGDDSFGEWLRGLPVDGERTEVFSYDGELLHNHAAGVVALDLGERDLQQCADTIIRLRAEYLWAADRADEVSFRFTNGDISSWERWRKGERFVKEEGDLVARMKGKRSSSYANFRSYLRHLFIYAGTHSLPKDAQPVTDFAWLPGDFFVQSGSPGHAVILLDVAENQAGERVGLVAQGFMPAQELHVVRSSDFDGVWYPLPSSDDEVLWTSFWRAFEPKDGYRFDEN